MSHTFFTVAIIILFANSMHAQFYTVTRNSPVDGRKVLCEKTHISSAVADPVGNVADSIMEEKSHWSITDKKSFSNKSNKRKSVSSHKKDSMNDRPALTIHNLIKEIRNCGISFPDVVLAQAILETGWFTSSVCKNKNNLFGLTNPRTGDYYEFSHWTESVAAYYSKVQYRYKGGNYLLWLKKIGYAEAPDYVPAVIRVMRQLYKY